MADMYSLLKSLYPLNRTLMGPDSRKSYSYFLDRHSEFKSNLIKTGEEVYDWTIPDEWIIRDAYLQHESGQVFASFSESNLHIVGYSIGIDEWMDKESLDPHIYTLIDRPHAIPYVTSYYRRDWGFCMSYNDYKAMPNGKYRVFIDAEHQAGNLQYIEAYIPGRRSQEIFFSSYLCHPSMANNELSGPVLIDRLLSYVKSKRELEFSYRFLIAPETIGAIAFLSKNQARLKKSMLAGFVLSCVGDDREYTHISSPNGDSIADSALRAALIGKSNAKEVSFLERGSDERQYCSPRVRLPVCTFCRSKFGSYPEYHTSDDNLDLVTEEGLQGSFDVIASIIDAFETIVYPVTNVMCEPNLGKRNLYPTISKLYRGDHPAKTRMDILAYADGENSIFDIANKLSVPLTTVIETLVILQDGKLVVSDKAGMLKENV